MTDIWPTCIHCGAEVYHDPRTDVLTGRKTGKPHRCCTAVIASETQRLANKGRRSWLGGRAA